MSVTRPYRKGDRVVITGRGRTAQWSKVPGTVAQVLSPTSVEVTFDDAAFGHEMSLEEITPLPDFYYAQLVHPQRLFLGTIGDAAIYADCADCGGQDAIIHGCIQDKHGQTAVMPIEGGIVFPRGGPAGKLAVFCEECFARRLAGGQNFSSAAGVLAFPQHPLLL
jgi:hypothetical protein